MDHSCHGRSRDYYVRKEHSQLKEVDIMCACRGRRDGRARALGSSLSTSRRGGSNARLQIGDADMLMRRGQEGGEKGIF